MLTRLIGARSAVEVGTFTGYSSLCIAAGLAADGRLLCCDVSEEWTAIARGRGSSAGVADRIDLRIAPGADTLRALPDDETIDLAFIDADKPSYAVYYEELLAAAAPERRDPRRQRAVGRPGRRRPTPTDDNTVAIQRVQRHGRRRRPRRRRHAPDRRRPHPLPQEARPGVRRA